MRAMLWAIAAGAVLALPSDSFAQAGRASGSAQGRVEQREGRSSGSARGRVDTRRDDRYERRDDRDRRYDRRDYDRRYDNDRGRNGKGPKFCRNGSGHPVHGRAWCRDKGWDRDQDRNRSWDRVDWGDVIFGRGDRRGDRFDSNILLDLLGDRVYGRLENHRRSRGYDSRLDARWGSYGSGHVLQVFAGSVPVAQLIDANRDGRAEMVLLNRR